HAAAMLGRDPLAPAPQPQLASLEVLLTRQLGIATEEEICRVTHQRQRPRQPCDSDPEPSRPAVDVRSFEAEDHKYGAGRIEIHREARRILDRKSTRLN